MPAKRPAPPASSMERDRMSNLLNHALLYAARGWAVFPVHTPSGGKCSCNRDGCDRIGKHPRITNGRNGASTDPDVINRWWSMWPEANIGIATGQESGIIVLDVDHGGEDTIREESLYIPDTAEQITGSGGRHVIFKRPDDESRYKTMVQFKTNLDSRADGGYIVAPPSLHESGSYYEWEASSNPIDESDPAPLSLPPEWFVNAIFARPLEQSMAEAPEWNPDGELPNYVFDMLSYIPADNYKDWWPVCAGLHHTDPIDGFAVFDWWSGTSPKYNPSAVRLEWANQSRKKHQVPNPITFATIRRMAEEHGWIDPEKEHGAEVAAVLIESHQRKIMESLQAKKPANEKPIDPPADMVPTEGVIKDLVDYMMATSIRPQRRLAVAAAISFIGAIIGRKYQTETGLRSNVYMVALAQSGHGKDHARKVISELATLAQVDEYIGGDSIASGQAIVSALQRNPSQLFMLDEFGKFIAALTGTKAAPHQRDIITKLMVLYSTAGSIYRGTEYADQKERPRQDIYNPNACVYGTSIPENFWGAMSSAEGGDGTLSRLLIVEAEPTRPDRQRPQMGGPDSSLIESLQAMSQFQPGGGNLSGKMGADIKVNAQVVPMTHAVFDAWEALDDDMTENMQDSVSASIYSRVAENTAKLAMIYAVSRDHVSPVIDPQAFAWARELALWSANTLMHNISRNVADNDQEATHKRVSNIIRDAGEEGISRRDLLRKCRFLRVRELDEIVRALSEAEEVVLMSKPNKRGKPTMMYYPLQ